MCAKEIHIKWSYILIILVFTLSGCAFFRPSAPKLYYKTISRNPEYEIVIVPGAPIKSVYSDKVVQMRVIWAVHLYKRGITKKIMMSGSAVSTPYKESVIMKLYAISLGVPEEDVYTEENSQHTTENVWYGYHASMALGYKKIALATDSFQTRMIYGYVKRKMLELGFLPVLYDTLKTLPDTLPAINIDQYKIDNFTPLHESQNRFQLFRGTIGGYIDYKKKEY